jgi:hypothetical protein
VGIDGNIQGYKIIERQADEVDVDSLQRKFSKKLENNLYTPDYRIVGGTYDAAVGSGEGLVDVQIRIYNNNNVPVKVTFPTLLIAKSSTGKYQNGILLKKASVEVPANTNSYKVMLVMYCGNGLRHASSTSEIYDKLIVSDSKTLKDLADRVANKKINVEEFTDAEEDDYEDMTGKLQWIVWSLTERYSSGLTQGDKDYIAALPDSI